MCFSTILWQSHIEKMEKIRNTSIDAYSGIIRRFTGKKNKKNHKQGQWRTAPLKGTVRHLNKVMKKRVRKS